MAGGGWGELREQLQTEVRRVADRLRNLSSGRLAAPPGPPAGSVTPGATEWSSRAAAAHAVAQHLATAAAALEAAATGSRPRDRELPVLRDHACGDQLAITGHDLLAAMDLVDPGTEIDGMTARDLVANVSAQLTDVRRRL